MKPKQAPNGCKNIHKPAQKPATGHAMKTKRIIQSKAKQGLDAIVVVRSETKDFLGIDGLNQYKACVFNTVDGDNADTSFSD
mmetsp:Transcript_7495/g.10651  ORF Transcript_7495/g.10651 Transcript_7495/m.10651 type:complete len:82 (-) Transcript_7495:58-303(-)